jgi:hypothetical protein
METLIKINESKGLFFVLENELDLDNLFFKYYRDYEVEDLVALSGIIKGILDREIPLSNMVMDLISDFEWYWSTYNALIGTCIIKKSLTKVCFTFPTESIHTLSSGLFVFLYPSCIPNDALNNNVISNFLNKYNGYTMADFKEMYVYFFNLKHELVVNQIVQPFMKQPGFIEYLDFVCQVLSKILNPIKLSCSNQA